MFVLWNLLNCLLVLRMVFGSFGFYLYTFFGEFWVYFENILTLFCLLSDLFRAYSAAIFCILVSFRCHFPLCTVWCMVSTKRTAQWSIWHLYQSNDNYGALIIVAHKTPKSFFINADLAVKNKLQATLTIMQIELLRKNNYNCQVTTPNVDHIECSIVGKWKKSVNVINIRLDLKKKLES